jgi:hypothetical protein
MARRAAAARARRDHQQPRDSRFPNKRAGELRTATQAVDQFLVDLDTPMRGTPIVPAAPVDLRAITNVNAVPPPPVGMMPVPPTAMALAPAARGSPSMPDEPTLRRAAHVDRPTAVVGWRRFVERQHRGWIAAGAVGTLALVAIVATFFEEREPAVEIDGTATAAPPVAVAVTVPADAAIVVVVDAPPPSPASPDAPPDAAIPDTVKLSIVTKPSEATVLLDGRKLGKTPLERVVDGRDTVAKLQIRKRGYKSYVVEIRLDADLRQEVTLRREW